MAKTGMKMRIALAVTFVAALGVVGFWDEICDAFGPMKQHESQCLICHRNRVEKWVCGSPVKDEITTNEYSDWIDAFVSIDHEHVWMGHTMYNRSHWFAGKSIGCGGVAIIPCIFEQREQLGEPQARELARRFHEMVKNNKSQLRLKEFDAFTRTVVDDPQSLLNTETEK